LKELQSAGKSGEFYTPRAITQFITEIIKYWCPWTNSTKFADCLF
jgi:hypothetical protein